MENTDTDRLHVMLIERANADASKRVRDKQKKFGKLTDLEEDMVERAEVDLKNRNALVELMRQHKLLIPAREFRNWRPTLRVKGQIQGLYDHVQIIATNGVLGWFLNGDIEPLCGHIQTFDGDVLPLFSMSKKGQSSPEPKSLRKKSKRQQILDSL